MSIRNASVERLLEKIDGEYLYLFHAVAPGILRTKLVDKLLTSGPTLTPLNLLANLFHVRVYRETCVRDVERILEKFEADNVFLFNADQDNLPDLDALLLHPTNSPIRFFHPDRLLRLLLPGAERFKYLTVLFTDPLYCPEDMALPNCIKYLGSFERLVIEFSLKSMFSVNPLLIVNCADRHLVETIFSDYPSLVNVALRGFIWFRSGSFGQNFQNRKETTDTIKFLLSKVPDEHEREKFHWLLVENLNEVVEPEYLESLHELSAPVLPGLPGEFASLLGAMPASLSTASHKSASSTSPVNPQVFFSLLAGKRDQLYALLLGTFNYPFMSPYKMQHVKSFLSFCMRRRLIAMFPSVSTHALAENSRFSMAPDVREPSETLLLILHDLIFRMGPFEEIRESGEMITKRRERYFKMLEAVATLVYPEKMADIVAAKRTLKNKDDVVELFNSNWISKRWVITRILPKKGNLEKLLSDEEATAHLHHLAAKIFSDHKNAAFDPAMRALAQLAGTLAHSGNNSLLLAISHDSQVRRLFLGVEEMPIRGIAFTKFEPVAFCFEDPTIFSECRGFMQHIFPSLSFEEKKSSLADWMKKPISRRQEVFGCLSYILFCRPWRSDGEGISMLQFLLARSMLEEDYHMAEYVLWLACDRGAAALQGLAEVMTSSNAHLWVNALFNNLYKFFKANLKQAPVSLLLRIVMLMTFKGEWQTAKDDVLLTLFKAVFYQTGSIPEAEGIVRSLDLQFKVPAWSVVQSFECAIFDDAIERFWIETGINLPRPSEVLETVMLNEMIAPAHLGIPCTQAYNTVRHQLQVTMFALVVKHDGRVLRVGVDLFTPDIKALNISLDLEHVKVAMAPLGIDFTGVKTDDARNG